MADNQGKMVDTLLDNKVEDKKVASSRVVVHDYILEEVDVHGNNGSEEVEDHDACMMALISVAET